MQDAAAIGRIRAASHLARRVPEAASSAMAISIFQIQEKSSVEDWPFLQFETVCTARIH
jgi:hypothetical protein